MAGIATVILPGQEALFTLPPASSDHPIGRTRLSLPGRGHISLIVRHAESILGPLVADLIVASAS
jgi:hypothetical protein